MLMHCLVFFSVSDAYLTNTSKFSYSLRFGAFDLVEFLHVMLFFYCINDILFLIEKKFMKLLICISTPLSCDDTHKNILINLTWNLLIVMRNSMSLGIQSVNFSMGNDKRGGKYLISSQIYFSSSYLSLAFGR